MTAKMAGGTSGMGHPGKTGQGNSGRGTQAGGGGALLGFHSYVSESFIFLRTRSFFNPVGAACEGDV